MCLQLKSGTSCSDWALLAASWRLVSGLLYGSLIIFGPEGSLGHRPAEMWEGVRRKLHRISIFQAFVCVIQTKRLSGPSQRDGQARDPWDREAHSTHSGRWKVDIWRTVIWAMTHLHLSMFIIPWKPYHLESKLLEHRGSGQRETTMVT